MNQDWRYCSNNISIEFENYDSKIINQMGLRASIHQKDGTILRAQKCPS